MHFCYSSDFSETIQTLSCNGKFASNFEIYHAKNKTENTRPVFTKIHREDNIISANIFLDNDVVGSDFEEGETMYIPGNQLLRVT